VLGPVAPLAAAATHTAAAAAALHAGAAASQGSVQLMTHHHLPLIAMPPTHGHSATYAHAASACLAAAPVHVLASHTLIGGTLRHFDFMRRLTRCLGLMCNLGFMRRLGGGLGSRVRRREWQRGGGAIGPGVCV